MASVMQAAPVDLGPCEWCTHVQWSHKLGKRGCKELGCPCGKYEPPKVAPAPADDWPLPAAEIEDAEAAGLVVRPESPAAEHFACQDGTCWPDCPGCQPEPADEPEPEPAPVVADPAAQAESTRLVEVIDAELGPLAEAMEAEAETPYGPMPPRSSRRVSLVAPTELERLRAEVAQLHHVNVELGRARADNERLTRSLVEVAGERDTAKRLANLTAGDQAATAENLYASRRAHAEELARLREELDRANAGRQKAQEQLDDMAAQRDTARAALKKTAHAYLHTSIAAATQVVSRYDAHACLTCGARYGQAYTDHGCGPLTPVVVIIARADRPGADLTKEQ